MDTQPDDIIVYIARLLLGERPNGLLNVLNFAVVCKRYYKLITKQEIFQREYSKYLAVKLALHITSCHNKWMSGEISVYPGPYDRASYPIACIVHDSGNPNNSAGDPDSSAGWYHAHHGGRESRKRARNVVDSLTRAIKRMNNCDIYINLQSWDVPARVKTFNPCGYLTTISAPYDWRNESSGPFFEIRELNHSDGGMCFSFDMMCNYLMTSQGRKKAISILKPEIKLEEEKPEQLSRRCVLL